MKVGASVGCSTCTECGFGLTACTRAVVLQWEDVALYDLHTEASLRQLEEEAYPK